jgi:hypothetical protein
MYASSTRITAKGKGCERRRRTSSSYILKKTGKEELNPLPCTSPPNLGIRELVT